MANKATYVIGIAGGSGSGKTTLVHELQSFFEGKSVSIQTMDNYYFPRESQKTDTNNIKNYDLPSSIDVDKFVGDLNLLLEGNTVILKEYTFNNAQKEAAEIVIEPADVIIVEGLFVLHEERVKDLLDLSLFIHAKENLKVIRRIKRDRIERNYPLDDVLYRYEHHVLPAFDNYIKPYIDDVDLVINNNKNFDKALEIMKVYIDSKLS
jgi:uridine kinase